MPNQEILAVAEQFVKLARKYNWKMRSQAVRNARMKPANEEIATLLKTVTVAGFEPKAIYFGQAFDANSEHGGDGPGTLVNTFCPYYVLGQSEDYGDNPATRWLDETFDFASDVTIPIEVLIKKVAEKIENSQPLEPIQLTPEGDMLAEYENGDGKHDRDDDDLGEDVGIHKYCGGVITRHRATESADALLCGNCPIRVLIPKETETYGMLREHCANMMLFHRAARQHDRPLGMQSSWR